jgi:DNA-binding response OmpR family regulator
MIDPADVHTPGILIVDDCRDTASTLCELLKWKGYRHVAWTTDGKAVPDLVSRENCGLILLDMHMPRVSGLDVIHSLQTMAAPNDIAVVAISGDQRYRALSVAAGACAFLIKPFTPEQLEAAIASALCHAAMPLAGHATDA